MNSALSWLLIGGIVALIVFAKVWVLRHPKSFLALLIGVGLLIVQEPANAQ